MRVLVLGANGQLGSDVVRCATVAQVDVRGATRADADITDPQAVDALVRATGPQLIVNTTAWTDLGGCERDPGRAFAVNALGALNVARSASSAGAALLHISTDYVFDGASGAPYVEGAARRALNVYGASKLAGEDLAAQACPGATIVRVSGLFGLAGASGKGGNFVETMLRLARQGKPIRVIDDQVTSPTNTEDVARALLPIVQSPPGGEVHLAAEGCCSWFAFAHAIFEVAGLSPDLQPVTAAEYGGPVQRPAFSALASNRVPALPPWRDGLARYLGARARRLMPIAITESSLPGVLIVEPRVFGDERGFFMETYRYDEYVAAGIADTFVQDNHSRSRAGVLRGIHYQDPPQAKLLRCTAGALLDVAVDLRAGSPGFGNWVAVELSAANRRQLYVPAGFGHAFLALEDPTELQYRCSAYYAPEAEGAIRWDDPDIGIDWPISDPAVSARDATAMTFAAYAARPVFRLGEG